MGTSATFTIHVKNEQRHFVSFYDNTLLIVTAKIKRAIEASETNQSSLFDEITKEWGDDFVQIKHPRDAAADYHYCINQTLKGNVTVSQSASYDYAQQGNFFGEEITLNQPRPEVQANKEAAKTALRRSFIHNSKAWWYQASRDLNLRDEISISVHENEKLIGELRIEWPCCINAYQIRLFADSVAALRYISDLTDALSVHNDDLRADQICDLMLEVGFVDVTPTQNPYK